MTARPLSNLEDNALRSFLDALRLLDEDRMVTYPLLPDELQVIADGFRSGQVTPTLVRRWLEIWRLQHDSVHVSNSIAPLNDRFRTMTGITEARFRGWLGGRYFFRPPTGDLSHARTTSSHVILAKDRFGRVGRLPVPLEVNDDPFFMSLMGYRLEHRTPSSVTATDDLTRLTIFRNYEQAGRVAIIGALLDGRIPVIRPTILYADVVIVPESSSFPDNVPKVDLKPAAPGGSYVVLESNEFPWCGWVPLEEWKWTEDQDAVGRKAQVNMMDMFDTLRALGLAFYEPPRLRIDTYTGGIVIADPGQLEIVDFTRAAPLMPGIQIGAALFAGSPCLLPTPLPLFPL